MDENRSLGGFHVTSDLPPRDTINYIPWVALAVQLATGLCDDRPMLDHRQEADLTQTPGNVPTAVEKTKKTKKLNFYYYLPRAGD